MDKSKKLCMVNWNRHLIRRRYFYLLFQEYRTQRNQYQETQIIELVDSTNFLSSLYFAYKKVSKREISIFYERRKCIIMQALSDIGWKVEDNSPSENLSSTAFCDVYLAEKDGLDIRRAVLVNNLQSISHKKRLNSRQIHQAESLREIFKENLCNIL